MHPAQGGLPVIPGSVRALLQPDGGVLLDLDRGIYLGLNSTGALIWEQLEAGRAPAEILDLLASRLDAPLDRLRDDLHRFLASLVDRGLIGMEAEVFP